MTLGLECWGQGLKRRMQLINWWSIFKINEELDCSLPGFIMIYDHSFFLFLMVPKHKNLPYVSCFLGSGHFSFQIFLRVFFFFFLQHWKPSTMWLQMAWAFLCETFLSNAGHEEAMLESSAYITSFDKYDTCQKLDISQYKLLWSSFMFQAQYSIQRACGHPTTSPSPKGSVKNIWGRNKGPPHHGIQSSAWSLTLSSFLLCSLGWPGWYPWRFTSAPLPGAGKAPPLVWERVPWKRSPEQPSVTEWSLAQMR